MRKLKTLLIFLLLMAVVSLFSCTSSVTEESVSPLPSTSQDIPTTTELYLPIILNFEISPIPTLGETAELIFSVDVKELWNGQWEGRSTQDLAYSRAWVEFYWTNINGSYSEAKGSVQIPLYDVQVDGAFVNWEGNALENRNLSFRSSFSLPKEGIWKISGFFSAENWEEPLEFGTQIALANGTAVIRTSENFKSSPLDYLSLFPYGRVGNKYLNEESAHIILELDISKPPLVGEEALMSCRITSLHDVSDFSTQIKFEKRQEEEPINVTEQESNILINGDLEFNANLERKTPVEFSAIIKFPEEGEWKIMASGNSLERETAHKIGFFDSIEITITEDKAFYGWEERPIIPTIHYTAPTTTTTSTVE